jgi:hypothetical protein
MLVIRRRSAATTALFVSIAGSALPTAGCDQVTVHTATNPGTSFEHYRTFSYGSPEDPARGYVISAWSAQVRERVQPLITAALGQKGYASASGTGDLVIRFGSGRRVVHVEEAEPPEGDQSLPEMPNPEYDVVERSLVIDAFDATNGARVWHGSSRAEIDPNRINEALLQTSVREMLASFPAAQAHAP